jgi:histidine ammonia-lyase
VPDAKRTQPRTIHVGATPLTIEDVLDLAEGRARAVLCEDASYRAHLARGRRVLDEALARGQAVYGVSTGVGDSCQTGVPPELLLELPKNLVRMHGAGTGRRFSERESAAIVAARLASLCRGYSAVRTELLDGLCALLDRRLLPSIPEEGSVGASGDLTPLSYIAACLIGERDAVWQGKTMPASAALAAAGLKPLTLMPKESLSIMNGTSVMTALACIAYDRGKKLARWTSLLTAMASEVMHGQPGHFDDRIFALKPHPGQRACARWIREDLGGAATLNAARATRLQDRYSLRCAPHVIGVLLDALGFARPWIETELNGVNDNPIVDVDEERIHSGGNFYGGHMAFVMDGMKTLIASIADLVDRQLVLLLNPTTNAGLPADLVGATGARASVNFGFKALGITVSALTAEALKLTMPASAFSRSTENHNQDKVSMGTIAARDCMRVLDLAETVAAIHTLALCQAADLRGLTPCHARSRALHAAVRESSAMHTQDRAMDVEIEALLARYRAGELPIGELDFA